jgi:MoaA/NifB/PqqE/SkfB family radical SAM enzyme
VQMRPLFTVSYSVATKCNLECKHCYSSSVEQPTPNELSTEEAFHLMNDLLKSDIDLLFDISSKVMKQANVIIIYFT